ncbi:MAG: four helix bundle protein [Bacteroidota bacterium]
MEPAKNFKDLIVWRKAHQHVLAVYALTGTFPKNELYGLTAQMRRAAVSVAANIVEGFKKSGVQDKLRYLNIAEGSLEECKYHALLSADLGYGTDTTLGPLADEVSRLLAGYAAGIRRRISQH